MRKMVNGEYVDLTEAEIAERQAEEAAWAARQIPTDDEVDQAVLNDALAAQGSVVRALAEVVFAEINKLRAELGRSAYTRAQFVAALKAKMRA